MNDRIELELIGITYNQIESGVYAVLLQQVGGTRRIPIIIGSAEAQSIECKLQSVITPRPLTHDLMVAMMRAFGLTLREVRLHRLPSGVFAADVVMNDGDRELIIDSRSSDALALAVRTGSPIYTTQEVLDEAGFEPENPSTATKETREAIEEAVGADLSRQSVDQLKASMAQAVEDENYEEAARIRNELKTRG